MIPALVLAAGLATRLRPLSFVRAKAALPVGGRPLAALILERLRDAGVRDAVMNLHHLPETLTARIGDGSDLGLQVRYSWEPEVLGSAGGPRRALPLLNGHRTFFIVNGDTISDVNLNDVLAAHRRTGALVTLAVVPNREPEKYSGLEADAQGLVTGVAPRGAGRPSLHFFGVQVAEADAFASVPDGTPSSSIPTLYLDLAARHPGSVRVHVCEAEYLDIGTPADYLRSAVRGRADKADARAEGLRVQIHPTATIDGSVLWDDVEIGEGAFLRECVVADGARIPADTSWTGVTLRPAPADGVLAPHEKRIGDLAVCAL